MCLVQDSCPEVMPVVLWSKHEFHFPRVHWTESIVPEGGDRFRLDSLLEETSSKVHVDRATLCVHRQESH